jgi:hypothetical protein
MTDSGATMVALKKGQQPQAKTRVERSYNEHFDNLFEEQWMSVYNHGKFGYSLEFVRVVKESPLAVMQRGEDLITIDHAGDVGDMTGISLRT